MRKENKYHFIVYATKRGENRPRLFHSYKYGENSREAEKRAREEFPDYKILNVELRSVNVPWD